MTTAYNLIFDSFMQRQTDYRLVTLFQQSEADFETYLLGFLIKATVEFTPICNQSLARDDTTKQFTSTLTEENIEMLSLLMHKSWLSKEVNDITQMRLFVQDHDFKQTSSAANLGAKQKLLTELKEECSQRLVEYGFRNVNFTNWANGEFGI